MAEISGKNTAGHQDQELHESIAAMEHVIDGLFELHGDTEEVARGFAGEGTVSSIAINLLPARRRDWRQYHLFATPDQLVGVHRFQRRIDYLGEAGAPKVISGQDFNFGFDYHVDLPSRGAWPVYQGLGWFKDGSSLFETFQSHYEGYVIGPLGLPKALGYRTLVDEIARRDGKNSAQIAIMDGLPKHEIARAAIDELRISTASFLTGLKGLVS